MTDMNIMVGGPVPLLLQLFDGSEEQSCVVSVFSNNGELLFESSMKSLGNGLYQAIGFAMPNQAFVVAQYQVLGTLNYDMPMDVFYVDVTQDIGPKLSQTAELLQNSIREVTVTMTQEAQKTQSVIETLFDDRIPSYADFWTGDVVEEQVDQSFWEGTILSGTAEVTNT
jgi:hypothetical protein